MKTRPALLLLPTLLALSACQANPGLGKLRASRLAEGGPAAAAAPAAPARQAAPTAVLIGTAMLPTGPFGDAELKAFLPGSTRPLVSGKLGANGRFVVALDGQVPVGGPVKLVATSKGQSLATVGLVAAGAGNLVGQDGATLIGPDGSSLIAAGAGNLVAAGGGNMIAAGAGNMIAAGAGNFAPPHFGVLATPSQANLTLATTLAVAALGPRLDAAGGATYLGGGGVVGDAAAAIQQAFERFTLAAAEALDAGGGTSLIEDVLGSVAADGTPALDPAVGKALSQELGDDFLAAARDLADALRDAVASGGKDTGGDDGLSFGDAQAEGTGEDPAGPLPGGSSGGAATGGAGGVDSAGGDGGTGGAGGSEDTGPGESSGTVTIHGQFAQPVPQSSTKP